ncbi:protein translocase subunit [Coemansia biformis]|uniref:Mitochondrial import inner membrane translocase subunit n=1 Tax=Coemansia biformis TaxID=1286918 RepID=A0A9W7Y8P5_9FUNG|nr:protein translocase subunit [Coemansia biformis]
MDFKLNEAQSKDEVMRQVRNEIAVASAQELISSINKHCFKMCISAPGPSLSESDKAGLSRCIDKYLSAWDTVSRSYVAHVQNQ